MKTELLAPAGNLEKAKFALLYGADAVYIGGKKFSLRARASNFDLSMIKELVEYAHELNKKVYVTIDLDILDPSNFPGTGTPEPGGISFKELMEGIHLMKNLDIVGGDIVELSPHYDNSGMSNAVAFKILREFILTIL